MLGSLAGFYVSQLLIFFLPFILWSLVTSAGVQFSAFIMVFYDRTSLFICSKVKVQLASPKY